MKPVEERRIQSCAERSRHPKAPDVAEDIQNQAQIGSRRIEIWKGRFGFWWGLQVSILHDFALSSSISFDTIQA